MNKKLFQGLLEGVRQMGAHMRGENVPGARVTAIEDIQPRQIREAAGLSHAEFARLIGVPVKTLQNWDRNAPGPRVRPESCSRSWPPIRRPLFRRCMLLASERRPLCVRGRDKDASERLRVHPIR